MSWKKVKLGNILKQYRIEHWVQNDVSYKQVTISKYDGVCFRGEKIGSEIGRKRQFLIDLKKYPYTLLFIRQGVQDGGIGVAPLEVDGCIVTENMPMFSIEHINVDYLNFIIKSPTFKNEVNKLVPTGSAQKAIHEKQLLEIEIPFPPIVEQEEIVFRLNNFQLRFQGLQKELDQQQTDLQLLRQTILQEAVQGKLTKQNPKDEPATELLQRIKAEKQKLIKEGKLKKEKELPPITEDEIPFALPEGWVWCRLGEVIDLRSGVTLGKVYKEDLFEVPYLRVANVQRGYIDVTHVKTIQVTKSEIEKYNLEDGDLCMIEGGDWDKVGRCGIWNNEISPCIHQNHIFRLRFYGAISNLWSEMYLNSPIARRYFESYSKQTTNLASINKTQLTNLMFPLPPLPEQQRIVAKVQQLQQQLSTLEAQVQQSGQYAQQLLGSVLREAFEGKGKLYEVEDIVSMVAEE